MSHCVFESFQVSFLLTAQLRQSSWRQQIPWETTIALPTPTLKLFSRATALMESKYRSSLCILSSVMTSLNSHDRTATISALYETDDLNWRGLVFAITGESSCSDHHALTTSLKTALSNTQKEFTTATKSSNLLRITCECLVLQTCYFCTSVSRKCGSISFALNIDSR